MITVAHFIEVEIDTCDGWRSFTRMKRSFTDIYVGVLVIGTGGSLSYIMEKKLVVILWTLVVDFDESKFVLHHFDPKKLLIDYFEC